MPKFGIEIRANGTSETRWIDSNEITLGRQASNAVVLSDQQASRAHVAVSIAGDRLRVRDLGSSNGTYVNGRRIVEATLGQGESFVIGSTSIRVIVEPDPPAADMLTEADLVDVSVKDSDNIAIGNRNLDDDYEVGLEQLASELPDPGFTEGQITMLNSKGRAIHAAGAEPKAGQRRDIPYLFRLILHTALRCRVSDLHLEPRRESYLLRMRVDGVLIDAAKFPTQVGVKLASVVKVLSEIDLAHREAIQEGRFSTDLPTVDGGKRRIDYRVSFAPSVYGQKLVLRVLDPSGAPAQIQNLGLPHAMAREIADTIALDAGMVLVGGPTGGGKTTSLYALLRSIDRSQRNVVTIEDPVEIQIDGITQIPVDEERDKTFASILRSVLRQDPDVILVGEIRDGETAKTALQASITGHLVFSSIHAKDTVGSLFRLMDLGADRQAIARGMQLVLSQRLVRTLCPACRRAKAPTAQQLEKLGPKHKDLPKLYEAGGCGRCLGTGFSGRRAIFELLVMTDALRGIISRGGGHEDCLDALKQSGFITLLQSGYDCAARGLVSMIEVERAVGR